MSLSSVIIVVARSVLGITEAAPLGLVPTP